MSLVTATFSTGGSVVITDAVEVTAINALTTATGANTAALGTLDGTLISLLGSSAAVTYPGGLVSIAAAQESHLKAIHKAILDQTAATEKLIVAVSKVSNSMETSTTGMANIQHTLTKQVTTQQLAVADQIKNNKFQQATTNAALADAGKPPTEVKPDDMKASVISAVQDISLINAQSQGAAIIEEAVTEGISQGFKISTEWIGQTEFAKWVKSYYGEAKIQASLLFADEKTKRELEKQLQEIKSARLNPAAAGGPS